MIQKNSVIVEKLQNDELVTCTKINITDTIVAEVARRHGKFAGTVGSTTNMKELYDMGYRFISMGADVIALNQYYADIMKQVKEWK